MSLGADLHLHSFYSDGSEDPRDIVARAKQHGLAAISLTDHDTTDGVAPAMAAGEEEGVEVIPGIEFSTEMAGKDIHILGYFFDTAHPDMVDSIVRFQNARRERIKRMLENLRKEGVDDISLSEVCNLTRSGAVGRLHLALILKAKGRVREIGEAFEKYLGEGCAAYEPKYRQTPMEAIALVERAGGVAVLAHPMVTNRDEIIAPLVEAGLGGIEVRYPNCSEAVTEFYTKLAAKYHLAMTGGSDSHGKVRSHVYVGKVRIPMEWVEELRQRAGR